MLNSSPQVSWFNTGAATPGDAGYNVFEAATGILEYNQINVDGSNPQTFCQMDFQHMGAGVFDFSCIHSVAAPGHYAQTSSSNPDGGICEWSYSSANVQGLFTCPLEVNNGLQESTATTAAISWPTNLGVPILGRAAGINGNLMELSNNEWRDGSGNPHQDYTGLASWATTYDLNGDQFQVQRVASGGSTLSPVLTIGGVNGLLTPRAAGVGAVGTQSTPYGSGTFVQVDAGTVNAQVINQNGSAVLTTGGFEAAFGAYCPGTCGNLANFIGAFNPKTVTAGEKIRNVTCEAGTAGTGGVAGFVVKVRDVTASSDLCSCTINISCAALNGPFTCDCNSGTLTAGHIYEPFVAASSDCSIYPSNVFCNVGLDP